MRTTNWVLGLFLLGICACGGKAIVDDPLGAGGSGGAGGASGSMSSATGMSSNSVSPSGGGSTDTSSGGTTSGNGGSMRGGSPECEKACAELWTCTQEGDLCPGLSAEDEAAFTSDCLSSCEQLPIGDFIDPNECAETIGLLKMLSQDFNNSCDP
jgi:hypothetical protein